MLHKKFYLYVATLALFSAPALAEYKDAPVPSHELSLQDRMSLARQFVANISRSLKDAGKTPDEIAADVSNIPDGEDLLFRIRLGDSLYLDTPILSRVEKGEILVSLRDFIGALEFPINYDNDTGNANGWYIRENRRFELNLANRSVSTVQGNFTFSDDVIVEGNDAMVPLSELGTWFNFGLKPRIQALDFALASDIPLPIQEKLERQNRLLGNNDIGPPTLPLQKTDQKPVDVPLVDVFNTSEFKKFGDGKKNEFTQRASVQTGGDFAKGTLVTQSQWDKEDKLTNLRANYLKESLDPELLGPLKARRYELGDVSAVNLPLVQSTQYGLGARVTNADPQRSYLRPTTEIKGFAFPGWDVELYRENQLLGFKTVDNAGTYRFEDVDLNTTENRFRVVFYGPQGEIREEEIFVPVDPKRLSDSGAAYDVAVTRQNTQTYRKTKSIDKDDGALNVTALVEKPIGGDTALNAAIATRQDNGNMKGTIVGGISTSLFDALVNANTAVDTKGEMAAEIVARRKFGQHEFRNETQWNTDLYGIQEQDDIDTTNGFNFFGFNDETTNQVFSNEFGLNGPFPFEIGLKPRYNLSLNYGLDSQDNANMDGIVGFSTVLKPIAVNQQFRYNVSDNQDEDKINSLTTLSGRVGQNRLRLAADYEIKPENKLDRLVGQVQRRITPTIESLVGVQHSLDRKFTEGGAQVTWDAGFAQISPGVTYNSNQDLTATVNTRFGLVRDPLSGSIKSFEQPVSTSGAVSAFVYLDKNGDRVFNDGDEPIEGVAINAPQSGGKAITNEEGYAFFRGMASLRATDVFLEEQTLPDPYWVSGFEGVSIVPRQGHVVPLEFPVHIAGELDGTIYKKNLNGSSSAVRGVSVSLYDSMGKNIQSSFSESDGFYLFSRIPPGTYYMAIDDNNLGNSMARPWPQKIQIGYDGTTIYGNNLYLQEGRPDVPLSILSTKGIFGERNDEFSSRNFAINLGTYKSRLSMALAWFKIQAFHRDILQYADLVSKPTQAMADKDSNKYILRLSYKDNDLNSAYKTCAVLTGAGNPCTLEILPGGLEQTKLAAK